jgi:hypothetical protein
MRAAELAGRETAQALAAAIGERDLTGARDVPAVIDARLRHRVGNCLLATPVSEHNRAPRGAGWDLVWY